MSGSVATTSPSARKLFVPVEQNSRLFWTSPKRFRSSIQNVRFQIEEGLDELDAIDREVVDAFKNTQRVTLL